MPEILRNVIIMAKQETPCQIYYMHMSNLLHACTTLIIALKRCSKRDDGVYLPGYNQVTSNELMIAS